MPFGIRGAARFGWGATRGGVDLGPRRLAARRRRRREAATRGGRTLGGSGLLSAVIVLALTPLSGSSATRPGQSTASAIPAVGTGAVPSVGPLFGASLARPHWCTAALLAVQGRDVVLTAAHCLRGTAAGVQFVPGYSQGRAPYGVWQVTAAYVDPRWLTRQDPQHDYALLVLAPHIVGRRRVLLQESVRGNVLWTAPAAGQLVNVVGYRAGVGDRAIACTARVYWHGGYPAFDCHGYTGGTSGAPFLTHYPGGGLAVRGAIGGLTQGGCLESTSYTSRFAPDAAAVLRRAQLGSRPDVLPAPRPSGC